MEFLTGKDYPRLCEECRRLIDSVAMMLAEAGPDADDPEAPLMWAYDHRMFCGGHECLGLASPNADRGGELDGEKWCSNCQKYF